jgi:hypothetical protein
MFISEPAAIVSATVTVSTLPVLELENEVAAVNAEAVPVATNADFPCLLLVMHLGVWVTTPLVAKFASTRVTTRLLVAPVIWLCGTVKMSPATNVLVPTVETVKAEIELLDAV